VGVKAASMQPKAKVLLQPSQEGQADGFQAELALDEAIFKGLCGEASIVSWSRN